MRQTLGLITAIGLCGFSPPVNDEKYAIAIADKVCGQAWQVEISRWRARLKENVWTAYAFHDGMNLAVTIPRNGPVPDDCDLVLMPEDPRDHKRKAQP